jgi:hypothetical protein
MPITMKRTIKDQETDGNETETEITFKRFVFRHNWFMLAQTDGAEYQMPAIPEWNRARALRALNVEEIPFQMLNGNCQPNAKLTGVLVTEQHEPYGYFSIELPRFARQFRGKDIRDSFRVGRFASLGHETRTVRKYWPTPFVHMYSNATKKSEIRR